VLVAVVKFGTFAFAEDTPPRPVEGACEGELIETFDRRYRVDYEEVAPRRSRTRRC
jgi:hypothetical protein